MTTQEIEVLWARVDTSAGPDACWPWVGARTTAGYGRISLNVGGAKKQQVYAHRTVLSLSLGHPIPPKMCACHSCDNPPCCNPKHLWLGTAADNSADKRRKGRANMPRGEEAPSAKLTDTGVLAARAAFLAGSTLDELADRYAVADEVIRNAIIGNTWGHLGRIDAVAYERAKQAHMTHGEGHCGAKLTDDSVREIRQGAAAGLSQSQLATRFGVTRTTIQPILNGRTWKHVA